MIICSRLSSKEREDLTTFVDNKIQYLKDYYSTVGHLEEPEEIRTFEVIEKVKDMMDHYRARQYLLWRVVNFCKAYNVTTTRGYEWSSNNSIYLEVFYKRFF